MSIKRLLSLVAATAVLLLAVEAAADDFPFLKFNTPAVCTTEGGSIVDLSPGRYIPEPSWKILENEWKVLENTSTRLTAENKVLRRDDSVVGWKSVAAALIAGVLIGGYALDR